MPTPDRRRADDRSHVDRRVEAVDASALLAPVRSAVGDPAARVVEWRRERIAYDFLNPSSGGIYRFEGTADTRGGRVPWSLVLKVTRAAERLEHDPPLPEAFARTIADAIRWDRELTAYESGFLAALDGELAAARYHGGARNDDDTCWLWLEDLTGAADAWPPETWAVVGHALGTFNGSFLASGHVPHHDWLGRRWLRVWVTEITPHVFGPATDHVDPAWSHPLVRSAYPESLRDRLAALWADRERLLAATEVLPQTCSHLDAHRRNLFLRRSDGRDEVVAIDWGLVGLAPPGEEIASTLVGTVASGEVAVDDAPALAELLWASYRDGLRDAGWRGDERRVRLAFAAAAGLRSVSILGLGVVDDEGRTDEEREAALARSSRLAALLVDLGDEARAYR